MQTTEMRLRAFVSYFRLNVASRFRLPAFPTARPATTCLKCRGKEVYSLGYLRVCAGSFILKCDWMLCHVLPALLISSVQLEVFRDTQHIPEVRFSIIMIIILPHPASSGLDYLMGPSLRALHIFCLVSL